MLYMAKWFRSEDEAKQFAKEHRGVLYKNTPRSRTKERHLITAAMMGFDPEKYRYSVNWNEPSEQRIVRPRNQTVWLLRKRQGRRMAAPH